jgi:hypothetical protein
MTQCGRRRDACYAAPRAAPLEAPSNDVRAQLAHRHDASVEEAAAVIALLLSAVLSAASPDGVFERTLRFETAGEGVMTLEAGCADCDWGVRGREAAVLEVAVDGRYSQHVVLFRGENAAYRLLLGPLSAGDHRLSVTRDARSSARGAGAVTISRAAVEAVAIGDPRYAVVAESPVLYARPGSLERFSDVPLLLYSEDADEEGRHERRYTYVFSNEDGGTPPDRLMATWGRVTDIELAFTRARDGDGTVRETIQAKDHVVRPFVGARLGGHPVLYVATRNNMFDDRGKRTVRLAPAPESVDLRGASREAVMDAHGWTYRVSASAGPGVSGPRPLCRRGRLSLRSDRCACVLTPRPRRRRRRRPASRRSCGSTRSTGCTP